MRITIKDSDINKYKKKNPLIMQGDISGRRNFNEGEIVDLVDTRKRFIARGYIGTQNKGNGWVLSYNKNEKIDFEFFRKKIRSAIKYREDLYKDESTNAFRIFNGEGDGIGGLTIDFYDGYYVINFYSEGIYKFRDLIINSLKERSDLKAIYEKKRFDKGGKYIDDDEFAYGKRGEFPVIVKENNIAYAVYLNKGAMVGIFTDQREVRKIIRDKYAKGKTVLNTFSYTGAFSVAAVLGNSKKTTSVDLAKRSVEMTREQFDVNNINWRKENIVVMDVFDYFKYAQRKDLKFDLTILDPPSFATSKKRRFSAAKDYKNLLVDAIKITEDKGVIVASTNCATFGMEKFKGFIEKAFKETNVKYKIVEEFTLPYDYKTIKEFKKGNYLKVLFLQLI